MKTLLLIRHAEAGWEDFGQADVMRKLTKHGEKQALEMCQQLGQAGFHAEQVLSSTAERAAKTAKVLFEPEGIVWRDDLYLASAQHVLNMIHNIDDALQTVAVVAHNPGLSELASHLCPQVEHGMPPCTVVALSWQLEHWPEIKVGTGELRACLYPCENMEYV